MKLVFTRLAHKDLVHLRQFIAEHEPMAAARAANRIKTVAELLTDQPLLGRPVSSPSGETRTKCCETRYVYYVFGIRVKNENRTLALMAVLFVVTS